MPILKVGPEVLVNTTTLRNQLESSIAPLANGRYVVAWRDSNTVDFGQIRARILNADGSEFAPEFLVNTTTDNSVQSTPDIATLTDGRFAVSWRDDSNIPNGEGAAVRIRIFNADGSQSVPEFVAPTAREFAQYQGSIAALTDGRFVLSWTDDSIQPPGGDGSVLGVNAKVFNADGSQSVPQFVANSTTFNNQYSSSTTGLANGRFVVTWTDSSGSGGDTSVHAVRARVFNADGSQFVPEFLVNTTTAAAQDENRVASLPGGRFVVTWTDSSATGGDTSGSAIRARIFNDDGSQSAPEFLVNTTTISSQTQSSVAALADGRFVVTWSNPAAIGGDSSGQGIFARLFNADGSASTPEFIVNTTTNGNQIDSSIAVFADGRFAVSWTDFSTSGGDTDGTAVRAQVFDPRRYDGTSAAETVTGGAFNDSYLGFGGGDSISGFAGNDLLIGDGPLSLTAAAQWVRRLYVATLDRGPDDAGWAGWTVAREGGQTQEQIAAGFVGSSEFQTKYGALGNAQFVTLLYQNVLDRNPDAGGLAAFTQALDSGALTRTAMVVQFSDSAEFRSGTNPELHAGQIHRLYGATLARQPDAGGFEGWTDALGGGRGLVDIAGGFVGSGEFQARYGSLDNTGFVTLLYQNVLGRAPDQAGLDGWLQLMSGPNALSRTQVVTGFSESGEYVAATRGALEAFMRGVMTSWSDTLVGGQGDDSLTGGKGSDRFVFTRSESGNDIVYGFESFDTLQLTGFGFANPAQARAAMSQQGANVVLAYTGGSITFADTQLSQLQSLSAEGWLLA